MEKDNVIFLEIDVDDSEEIADKYEVESMPFFMSF